MGAPGSIKCGEVESGVNLRTIIAEAQTRWWSRLSFHSTIGNIGFAVKCGSNVAMVDASRNDGYILAGHHELLRLGVAVHTAYDRLEQRELALRACAEEVVCVQTVQTDAPKGLSIDPFNLKRLYL